MAIIHIFGLNHFLQNIPAECWSTSGIEDEKEQKAILRDVLRHMIAAHNIDHIADEAKVVHESLGYEVAQKFGLTYTNITMPLEERERHGIRTPGYDRNPDDREHAYRVFERFMFEQIKSANRNVTLVLCGRRHLQSLADLFRAAKDDATIYDVLDCDWYRGIPIEAVEAVIGYVREDDGS